MGAVFYFFIFISMGLVRGNWGEQLQGGGKRENVTRERERERGSRPTMKRIAAFY